MQTDAYLEQITGVDAVFADDYCEEYADEGEVTAVEVSEIVVDGDRATATVVYTGGVVAGSAVAVELVEQAGQWKVDRRLEFPEFDREGFNRGYGAFLRDGGYPADSADCVLAKLTELSNEELAEAILDADRESLFRTAAITCDRQATERALIPPATEESQDYPPAAIACARDRVRTLSNERIVRMFDDFVALGRIHFGCGYDSVLDDYISALPSQGYDRDVVDCVEQDIRGRTARELVFLSYDDDAIARLFAGCGA